MNDEELIGRILDGEEHLFRTIIDRYANYVWAICLSRVHNHADCEDLVQKVFVACYQNLDKLRDRRVFSSWLCQMARRQGLECIRAKSRRDAAHSRYESFLKENGRKMYEDDPGRREHQQIVLDKVRTLPPKFSEALLLHYAEGCSVKEAAKVLGISLDAMKKRLQRGRAMLKERLESVIEPALATERHKADLETKVVAAIPFGHVSWLAKAGTEAITVSQSSLIGGAIFMWKKMIIGVGAILLMLLLVDVGRDLKGTHDRKDQTVETVEARKAVSKPLSPAPEPEVVHESNTANRTAVSSTKRSLQQENASRATPQEVMVQAAEGIEFASISGIVSDTDETPVPDVKVILQIGRPGARYLHDIQKTIVVQTGSDGRYEISDIDVFGKGRVFTSIPDYMMKNSGGWLRCDVTHGTKLDDVNVTLERVDHFVSGRVMSENGQAIAGAMVDLHGSSSMTKMDCTVTDEAGRFYISRPKSKSAWKFWDPGEWFDFKVWKSGYGTGFFPQIPIDSDNVEFILYPSGGIAGKVTTANGSYIEGAMVEVMGEAMFMDLNREKEMCRRVGPLVTVTGSEGNYAVGDLSGDFTYIVAASTSAGDGRRSPFRNNELSNARESASIKKNIRVTSGKEISGVDLILYQEARLYGKVKYKANNQPAYPLKVCVGPWNPDKSYGYEFSGNTKPDGSYSLTMPIDRSRKFFVFFEYGEEVRVENAVVGSVNIRVAQEKEFDFAVPAPCTLTVRLVEETGWPVPDVKAHVSAPWPRGFFKTSNVDEEGRAEFSGIPPYTSFRVEAVASSSGENSSSLVMGRSEPVVGEPGEHIDDVLVVCAPGMGGIRGVIVETDGNPIADTAITCRVPTDDGKARKTPKEKTDSEGAFAMPSIFPQGEYPKLQVLCWRGTDLTTREDWQAVVKNVEIAADEVTDLGTITVKLVPNKWRDSGVNIEIEAPLTPWVETELERILKQSANI
ncbi:sigma-70 family RNA polymerase sigma factor [Candidatus Hydrogenedentota bacterium]